ncbi:hypothetical protein [Streptomyces sp. NPDC000618]|uniref:hypothetical protein n=1 Tax=Streptomyces sp. NPDC000618 TaxID=3154265 RepID=UPI003316BDCC
MVLASSGDVVVPLLLVEVGNGTEGPPVVVDKVECYRGFFARGVPTGTGNGREVALWRTVWPAAGCDGCPPVALVFAKDVGPVAVRTRMREVGELARDHWRGQWDGDGHVPEGERPDGCRDYDGKVPLLATALKQFAGHGPHGPVWWRCGRSVWQSLADVLDDRDGFHACSVRSTARRQAREAEFERARHEQEERRRRMEAAKWVCPTCGGYVCPEAGLTPGGECRPCLGDLRRRSRPGPGGPAVGRWHLRPAPPHLTRAAPCDPQATAPCPLPVPQADLGSQGTKVWPRPAP